jgi:hypothetical protein
LNATRIWLNILVFQPYYQPYSTHSGKYLIDPANKSLDARFHTMLENLFSRFMGAIIRTMIILTAFIVYIVILPLFIVRTIALASNPYYVVDNSSDSHTVRRPIMNTSRSPLSNNGIQNIQIETTPDSVASSVPLQEGGSYVGRPNEGVVVKFDYNSMRAKQARLANVVGSNAVSLLGWGLSLVGFTVLAYIGPIMGETFLAAIGLLPWAIWWPIHIYYEYYLKDLKVKPQGQEPELQIDHILDQQVLARLNQNPSPQDIALSLKSTPASNYFGWRFGLG